MESNNWLWAYNTCNEDIVSEVIQRILSIIWVRVEHANKSIARMNLQLRFEWTFEKWKKEKSNNDMTHINNDYQNYVSNNI